MKNIKVLLLNRASEICTQYLKINNHPNPSVMVRFILETNIYNQLATTNGYPCLHVIGLKKVEDMQTLDSFLVNIKKCDLSKLPNVTTIDPNE